jgi:putative transposase
MTRLRRIEDRDRIFFVTFNLARRTTPLSPPERDLILSSLQEVRGPRGFLVFAYVVMPDHVHLLLSPQRDSLVRIIRDLKSNTGFPMAKERNSRGLVWQRSRPESRVRSLYE